MKRWGETMQSYIDENNHASDNKPAEEFNL